VYEAGPTRRWLKVKQKGWTVEEDREPTALGHADELVREPEAARGAPAVREPQVSNAPAALLHRAAALGGVLTLAAPSRW
jgi:hypothetical protein